MTKIAAKSPIRREMHLIENFQLKMALIRADPMTFIHPNLFLFFVSIVHLVFSKTNVTSSPIQSKFRLYPQRHISLFRIPAYHRVRK